MTKVQLNLQIRKKGSSVGTSERYLDLRGWQLLHNFSSEQCVVDSKNVNG